MGRSRLKNQDRGFKNIALLLDYYFHLVIGDSLQGALQRFLAKWSKREENFEVVANAPLDAAVVFHNSSNQNTWLEKDAGARFADDDFSAVCDFIQ
jgi:hypothetical protein